MAATATGEIFERQWMPVPSKIYTPDEVRLRLKAAFRTLRRLPDETPRDRIGSLETRYNRMMDRSERWSEALSVIETGSGVTVTHTRRKATPREIDHMDEALEWTMALDAESRSLLWAMAAGRRGVVGEIARHLGVTRHTVRRRYRAALLDLASLASGG
jgi:hypothetical protein